MLWFYLAKYEIVTSVMLWMWGMKNKKNYIDSIIEKVLMDYALKNPNIPKGLLDWNGARKILKQSIIESEKIQSRWVAGEISCLQASAFSLGCLALAANFEGPNRILKKDYVAKDLYLANWLINISNTCLAIIRLCSEGFDMQARMLVRCLHERVRQAIILFYSGEDYEIWHSVFDDVDSKQAYYTLFSRKGRINKRYLEIANNLGFKFTVEEVDEWDTDNVYFSSAIHAGKDSIALGSFGFHYDKDLVCPAVFGKASATSKTF